jgi:L-ascorbate metabolism protein UlaG (beta-lactamase superfamily)
MEIVWYGHSCFRLRSRAGTVLTDPCGPEVGYDVPRLRADIVTVSLDAPDYNNCGLVRGHPKVLRGPGEYEVKGIFITGIASPMKKAKEDGGRKNTIYLFDFDDLTVCHLGNLDHVPSQSQVQELSSSDVLLVPVGANTTISASQAAEVIGLLEPRLVVPMHFKTQATKIRLQPVSNFLSEMGLPHTEPRDSLDVTRSNLPAETKVVVLDYRH